MDIVQGTRRLALMNCYLHELEATIYYGDSLGEGPHVGKRYDIILTNPPFGREVQEVLLLGMIPGHYVK